MFNRFIYRRNGVFAFIVKRFRVFRAPFPPGSSATWVCPPDGTFSRMLSWAQIGVGPPITTEMLATE
ncbi:hypothetical protein ABLN67_15470 [Mycobacterium tuberculosis]